MTITHVETPFQTLNEFSDWLGSFNNSVDLAKWLGQHGITGIRGEADQCPLANLATSFIGRDVMVSYYTIEIIENGESVEKMDIPDIGGDFAKDFDEDWYPALVADDE